MWPVLVVLLAVFYPVLGDLVVNLKNGKVQGTTIDTPSGRPFYAWRGIPYGKPPVGKLRFVEPVEAEPWEGVLDASSDAPACLASGLFLLGANGQSEDCLYVNVYSPVDPSLIANLSTPLDVMFWIYGGAFVAGSANFEQYDPSPFLEENVIFVSFNYRLGALGFLSTEDHNIPGNAGLKDQVLALEWTRDNIASFGGNPESITIFGESAGGMSVGYHLVSARSKGLFKGAIMESGCALTNLNQPNARDNSYKLAKQVNSSISDNSSLEEVIEALQNAESDLILKAASSIQFGTVFEIESDSSFMSGPNYEQLKSGDLSKVPVIIGHNSMESITFIGSQSNLVNQAKQADANPELLVPDIPLKENATYEDMGREIHEEYVGENGTFSENLLAYLEWNSNNIFTRSIIKHAVLQSTYSPVYLYQFSYFGSSGRNIVNVTGAEGKVGHGGELAYLFNNSRSTQTDSDFLTKRRMVKLWTNFAKTSNPTPEDDSQGLLQNVKWVPVATPNVQYLDINEDLEVKPREGQRKAAFWDYIFEKYSYHPYYLF